MFARVESERGQINMCEHEDIYNPFPSVTIGGPPGDYLLPPPVTSNQYMEFKIVTFGSFGAAAGIVQVSGVSKPFPLDTSGVTTYNGENNNNSIRAIVLSVGPTSTPPFDGEWEQISSPNMHIFVRIDGATAAFVTIKQRAKVLVTVPAPFVTVPHQVPETMNVAREERILQAVYGTEGREVEYGKRPFKGGTVREFLTGSTDEDGRVKLGPSRRGE
jgi:hypothetical protein